MTTEQPIRLGRGEDTTISGTVLDEDSAVVDISADAILFTVKNSLSDTDANKVFQVSGTNLTVNGTFDIVIADSDTNSLDTRTRWYDIELVTSGGSRYTVSRGRFILTGEVTKA